MALIRKALQRDLRYQRPRKAAAAKQPLVERARQPVGTMVVMVEEEQGLVVVQALVQAVELVRAVELVAAELVAAVVVDQAAKKM